VSAFSPARREEILGDALHEDNSGQEQQDLRRIVEEEMQRFAEAPRPREFGDGDWRVGNGGEVIPGSRRERSARGQSSQPAGERGVAARGDARHVLHVVAPGHFVDRVADVRHWRLLRA